MSPDHDLALVLVDLAALILLACICGQVLSRFGQPAVLGEILAGVLIGPSLLGAIAPGLQAALFPPQVIALLTGIGEVGLAIFVFLIGLHIDRSLLGRHLGRVAKVSFGSLMAPFLAGMLIAIPLQASHPQVGGAGTHSLRFVLLIGTAFAVTAFPVLARILADTNLERSALGAFSLATAGMLDIAGWMMLGVVLAIDAGGNGAGLLRISVQFLAFAILTVALVAPLVHRLMTRFEEGSAVRTSILVAAILASAGAARLIGLHSVIGALLLGAAFPRQGAGEVLAPARRELYSITTVMLLPVYFGIAGMQVEVGALSGRVVVETVFLIAVAAVTKVVGTMAGAWWAGLTWREGLSLGVLMNTRGLVEVVVLSVGLNAGLLDRSLYSELILVAVATTLMTAPMIERLSSRSVALPSMAPGPEQPSRAF